VSTLAVDAVRILIHIHGDYLQGWLVPLATEAPTVHEAVTHVFGVRILPPNG